MCERERKRDRVQSRDGVEEWRAHVLDKPHLHGVTVEKRLERSRALMTALIRALTALIRALTALVNIV